VILTIECKHLDPDIVILEMAGRICLGSASRQVEWSLAELLKQNQKKIVFDLSGVTVLDSTGVGIVVMCYAKVKKAGGSLRITSANGMVEETLKMTNVDKIVPFYSSLADAAQNFQPT
jgi:anti-sigma B factor antagonist